MNMYAIRAIYLFEMARTWRTLMQSVASPVLSTSLYFVVFGSAIGSRMVDVDGIAYGAYIIPGLVMLSLLTQSIANASFGIYFPKFSGTIYEVLSAPVSYVEVVCGYVGAAASKSIILGIIILITARLFVSYEIAHPLWMVAFLVLTAVTFSLFGFIIGVWADGFEKAADHSLDDRHAADLPGRELLFDQHAAAVLAEGLAVQSGGLPDQRVPVELLRRLRREPADQHERDAGFPGAVPGRRALDLQDRVQAQGLTTGMRSCQRHKNIPRLVGRLQRIDAERLTFGGRGSCRRACHIDAPGLDALFYPVGSTSGT